MDLTRAHCDETSVHPVNGRPLTMRPNTIREPSEIERARAGNAAYMRAHAMGYGPNACAALRRQASREARVGEDAKVTALRIVLHPGESCMVPRDPGPRAA